MKSGTIHRQGLRAMSSSWKILIKIIHKDYKSSEIKTEN